MLQSTSTSHSSPSLTLSSYGSLSFQDSIPGNHSRIINIQSKHTLEDSFSTSSASFTFRNFSSPLQSNNSNTKLDLPPTNDSILSRIIQTKIPIFIRKLAEMLNDTRNHHCIRWSVDGETLQILNSESLLNDVIPRYYKQRSFRSFTRQLNCYGFIKLTSLYFLPFLPPSTLLRTPFLEEQIHKPMAMLEFRHPYFKRDQKNLYIYISRQSLHHEMLPNSGETSQVETLPTGNLSKRKRNISTSFNSETSFLEEQTSYHSFEGQNSILLDDTTTTTSVYIHRERNPLFQTSLVDVRFSFEEM